MSKQVEALREAQGAKQYGVYKGQVVYQSGVVYTAPNDNFVEARHLATALQFMKQQQRAT